MELEWNTNLDSRRLTASNRQKGGNNGPTLR